MQILVELATQLTKTYMGKENLAMACIAICLCVSCSQNKKDAPSLDGFRDGIHHWNLEHKERNYPRYAADDFESIADNKFFNKKGAVAKRFFKSGCLQLCFCIKILNFNILIIISIIRHNIFYLIFI